MHLVMLAIGAVLGALSRYAIGIWLNTADFPYGTLVINVSGCLAIGFFGVLAAERLSIGPDVRIAVQIGFLGSYTTFSSFGYETLKLMDGGSPGMAVLNILGNNGVGLSAVWLGMAAARAVF